MNSMRKSILSSVLLLVLSLIFSANCSAKISDKEITKNIEIEYFDKIVASGNFDIIYSDEARGITITGPEAGFERLVAEVSKGTLTLDSDKIRKPRNAKYSVTLGAETLSAIKLAGSVKFDAEDGIKTDKLEIRASGATDIDIKGLRAKSVNVVANGSGDIIIDKLLCKNLSININGSGDARFNGKADSAKLTLNGSATVDLRKLDCSKINTKANGASEVRR